MTSLKEEACSVSVFVTMASTVASSLDCEFLRTNNLLRIFAKLFQRADAAELASKREEPKKLQEMEKCKKEDCRPGEASGGSCSGIRFTSYNKKRILMMPDAGTADGADRGLRFAMLGGGVDDFSNSEKVIFTPGFHTRLQYFGYDPQVVMHLWTKGDSNEGAAVPPRTWACVDRPHSNLLDPRLAGSVFENGTRAAESSEPAPLDTQRRERLRRERCECMRESGEQRLHWMPAAKSRVTGDLISEAARQPFL